MDPAKGDAKGEDEHIKSPTKRANNAEQEKNLPCSSSRSNDSLEEGEDDFFQLDPVKLHKSLGSSQHPDATVQNAGEQPSHVTSTCPQTMDRYDVPDPNRIPSSIFTRNESTAPAEWSVTSNDSLFSINVGSLSFSNDQTIPAERAGDISPLPERLSEPQKTQLSGSTNTDSWKILDEPNAARGVKVKGTKEDAAATYPVDLSCNSDNSVSSFQSLAFPISAGGEGISSSAKVEPTEPIIVQQAKPPQPPREPKKPKPAPSRWKNKWISYFCCRSSCFLKG